MEDRLLRSARGGRRAIEHNPEKWIPVFGKDHAPTIEHDPEKWIPVAPTIEHDPEKWIPVFGKDHAPTIEHDPEKWIPVLGKDPDAFRLQSI
jgi:hypothetical protein